MLGEAVDEGKGEHFKDLDVEKVREGLLKVNLSLESKAEMDLIKVGLTKSKIDKFRNKIYANVSKSVRKQHADKKTKK